MDITKDSQGGGQASVSIDGIIGQGMIETLFQPVVDLHENRIIGYEALSRGPRESSLYMPSAMIAEAKSRRKIAELDALMRKSALTAAKRRELQGLLFINLDPIAVCGEDAEWGESVVFRSEEYGVPPERVVVEISERSAVCGLEKFYEMVLRYKKKGFRVGFDDIGTPLEQLSLLSSVSPNFTKLSGNFVTGAARPEVRAQLDPIITVARAAGSLVVAVGVETPEELRAVKEIGIDAAQGNLLGLPTRTPGALSEETLALLKSKP